MSCPGIPFERRNRVGLGSAALALLVVLSAGSGLLGASEAGARKEATRRWNVLILVADALRADALECYGGPTETPNICELAQRGVLFENASSNATWTVPSAVTMLTSVPAVQFTRDASEAEDGEDGQESAAKREGPSGWFDRVLQWWRSSSTSAEFDELVQGVIDVPADRRSIADDLRDAGYGVFSDVENILVPQTGVLRGFTEIGRYGQDGEMEDVLDFLAVQSEAVPFFLLRWTFDPHDPYDPPQGVSDRMTIDESRLPRSLASYRSVRVGQIVGNRSQDDPEVEVLRHLYQGEVESVDDRVGMMVESLRRQALLDRTIIVLTSDHGESFMEHGTMGHGHGYYNELTRVPLIIAGPGIATGTRIRERVATIDLLPTLRELLGLPADLRSPASSFSSLLTADSSDEVWSRDIYLIGTDSSDHYDALIRGSYKIIDGIRGVELYDLEADPQEINDLSQERSDLVEALTIPLLENRRRQGALQDRRRAASDPASASREMELRKALRALGYVD